LIWRWMHLWINLCFFLTHQWAYQKQSIVHVMWAGNIRGEILMWQCTHYTETPLSASLYILSRGTNNLSRTCMAIIVYMLCADGTQHCTAWTM
jgi:hypothetical protein